MHHAKFRLLTGKWVKQCLRMQRFIYGVHILADND